MPEYRAWLHIAQVSKEYKMMVQLYTPTSPAIDVFTP